MPDSPPPTDRTDPAHAPAWREALAGRYEVDRPIGEGGMATVLLARDVKHDRRVAIKVVKPELGAVLGVQRFLAEIEIVARLQHPNILPLYDSGEAGGSPFYVMPFMDGQSLRERITRERQLAPADVAKITSEVAQALTHAHADGIIHRDIKPENILFSGGVAVIGDFGIARAMAAAGGDRLTSAGVVLGTPLYMSPEQSLADAVDARSDVYSLACVVYEMLTGEPPFRGASAAAITASHVRDDVPSARALRPGLPKAVDAVLRRALAKVPDERFTSPTAFADALSAALVGLGRAPITATRRRITIAGAAVVVIVVVALAWKRTASASSAEPPRLVVLPFEHLGPPDDRFIADGMSDEVTTRVAGISGLSVIARASALHYAGATPRLADIGREMNVGYVVTASVRTDRAPDGTSRVRVTPHLIRVRGEQELWSHEFNANFTPGELFDVQSRIAVEVARALGVSLLLPEQSRLAARTTNDVGAYDAYLRGNVFASHRYEEKSARQAIEMYQRAVARDSMFAVAWARLAEAQVLYAYYFKDKVGDHLAEARAALQRAAAVDSSLTEVHLARGSLAWWGELNANAALHEYSAVLERQPANSEVLGVIGQVLRRRGQYADAAAMMRRAVELDPKSNVLALDLGLTLMGMRRYDESEAQVDRAIALAPDWASAVVMKALLRWTHTGSPDAARAVVEAALPRVSMREMLKWMYRYPTMPAQLGGMVQDSVEALRADADFVDPAKLYLAKGHSYRLRGDSARARAHFDSARATLERRSALAPGDAELHGLLGTAYAGLGRREDARREGDRGMQLIPIAKELVLGVTLLNHRIDIAVMNGDTDDALTFLTTAVRIPSQYSRAMVREDPFYAPLHTNPRFARVATLPEVVY